LLKQRADWVTEGSRGEGVIEVIDRLIADDLEELTINLNRHNILLGTDKDDREVYFQPHGASILLAGTSGGGKSTLATGILERLAEKKYQFCIIDPEGDYQNCENAIVLGDSSQAPRATEILDVLEQPNQNLIINLLGVTLEKRPSFFASLLPSILEMRAQTGRSHWLVVDEAHHMLPSAGHPALLTLPQTFNGILMITVHPKQVETTALSLVNTTIAVGQSPDRTIAEFCEPLNYQPPNSLPKSLADGEVLVWFHKTESDPISVQIVPPRTERHRHMRNYAEGNLGDDKCFYFRGAEAKLNLRAQNLISFRQLAEGIDEDTWLYHLHRQDYSCWFRDAIKDEKLAAEAEQVEKTPQISAIDGRDRIKAAIEERYTLPA
jgi:hypothetical protein